MKKILLFLMVSAAMISCSGDNDESTDKLPSLVTISGDAINLQYAFTYDAQKRLVGMSKTGDDTGSAQFAYGANGKVSSLSYDTSGIPTTLTFQYDDDKRLVSFTPEGSPAVAVTWTSDTTFTLDGSTVSYTAKGDLAQFADGIWTYSNAKRGMFASVKSFDPFTLALTDIQTALFASKKPIATVASSGTYTYTNSFEGGYVSTSAIAGNGATAVINVVYN